MALPTNLKKGITVWNRLEPRPRKVDFDRTLRAEVRDPLWMLTRQWQFGELKAEDTGTAIFARGTMETTKVTKLSKKGEDAVDFDQASLFEAEVEQEVVDYDLALRLEMGQHFFRILRRKLSAAGATSTEISTILTEFKTTTTPISLSFSVPTDDVSNVDVFSNRNVLKVLSASSQNRTIDGGKLLDYLKSDISFVSSAFVTSATYETAVNDAGIDFVKWFERVYTQPVDSSDSSWVPNRMEYQFACSAPEDGGNSTILSADEYYHGRLDWYSFDLEADQTSFPETLKNNPANAGDINTKEFTVVPSEVQFAGMPNARWWEMEDRNVDLGEIDANTTDTAKILLAEFGLIYSNDWTVIPWTVPVGSLSEMKNVVVTDVFGQRTVVEPAGKNLDNPYAWSMYGLNSKNNTGDPDNRLFIPPVINKMHESAPVEAVNFIRDEMANMVWGIETIIPNGLGMGTDGFEAATKFRKHMETLAGLPATVPYTVQNDAEIKYQIANTVPENWIPFIPVKEDTALTSREIKLQRGAMPRVIDGLTSSRIRPRTKLIQFGVSNLGEPGESWSPYYIHEEEIPRSGTVVKRTWQRARTDKGRVITWLGRRKTNGRGEGNSGLAFDQIVPSDE